MQRAAAAFIARKEFRVIESVAIDTLPCKDSVIAGRQAAQREASTLISCGFTIAIGVRVKPRFGHSYNHRIGDRFIFLIRGHALDARTIGARQHIDICGATAHGESRVRGFAAAGGH